MAGVEPDNLGLPLLTADSVALMTTDALTEVQRLPRRSPSSVPAGREAWPRGWDVDAAESWMAGRWGWDGGTGTTARVDRGGYGLSFGSGLNPPVTGSQWSRTRRSGWRCYRCWSE